MAGLFITFEGPDGVGKTTQVDLLAKYLRGKGFAVRCTREPGGTILGDKIRALLLDPANSEMHPITETLLYFAARAQHVAQHILPALAKGEIVLSDRFADSTLVYQGAARQLSDKDLAVINDFAAQHLEPDLTILLDGEVDLLSSRLVGRGGQDRIEQEGQVFQEKVREAFRQLASREPERIKVIESCGSIEEVHQAVVVLMEDFFHRRASDEGK